MDNVELGGAKNNSKEYALAPGMDFRINILGFKSQF